MAAVQNFGNTRIVKRVAGKTLGDDPGWLVTDASDALEVHIMEMPPITVSVPPVSVNLSVVSVTQGTSPWLVAGDVSTTIVFPASAQVFVNNPVSLPVPVTFSGAASVTGEVSVKNFPTVTSVTQGTSPWVVAGDVSLKSAVSVTGQVSVVGPVSVTGQVSVVSPVSVTGHVSIDNASTNPVQITVQSFQTAVSVTGQVSVVGQVSVLGNVSITPVAGTSFHVEGNVSAAVAGNVSVIQNTSPWVVSLPGVVSVAGNVSAAVAGNVSVIQNTSPWVVSVPGVVSIVGQVSVLGAVSVVGQVSVLGNVSVATARVNLTAGSPTHVSVAAST